MGRQRTIRRMLLLIPAAVTLQLLYRALSSVQLPHDRDLGEVPTLSPYSPFNYANRTIQLDMMVPVFERDDRLREFAMRLGKALKKYRKVYREQKRLQQQQQQQQQGLTIPEISVFRLLATRFTPQERATSKSLQLELANITGIPAKQIVMVHAPRKQSFSRAGALNMLHAATCQHPGCMATRLDVDMKVRHEFFTHAVEAVLLRRAPSSDELSDIDTTTIVIEPDNLLHANSNTPVVYVPIVWSAYNKESVKLVHRLFREEQNDPTLKLPEFNEHRGHWREYGTGMYVMEGSDAHKLSFNMSFEGWGGEDNDFYQRVKEVRRIMRRNETGLIHRWHPKQCTNGTDIRNERQARNCRHSVNMQMGSKLGRQLLKNNTAQVEKKGNNQIEPVAAKNPPMKSRSKW